MADENQSEPVEHDFVEGSEKGVSLDYLNAKRTYDVYQDLDVERARRAADLDAERARSNNAAHDLLVTSAAQATAALMQGIVQTVVAGAQAVTTHAKDTDAVNVAGAQGVVSHGKNVDQVTIRGAQNAETSDNAFAEQAVFDARARSAAIWGSGVAPVMTATVGKGADDIADDEDDGKVKTPKVNG